MLTNEIILYRLLERPVFEGGCFSGTISKPEDKYEQTYKLIIQIWNSKNQSCFKELLIDKIEVITGNSVPEKGDQISFIFSPPTSSSNRFFENFDDFTKKSGISKGKIPKSFYIVQEDLASFDQSQADFVEKVGSLCQAIKLLASLANYHDEKSQDNHQKLVFLQSEKSQKPAAIVLKTLIKKEMLFTSKLNLNILEGLCSEDFASNPHLNVQIGVFSVSLGEFLEGKSHKAFYHLIMNWNEFLNLYQRNLETFLSGFAFHKAKKEIAEAELNIASRLTELISNLTGKLLSIPVSFAAVSIIAKSNSFTESLIIVIGLIIITFLISEMITNQKFQFNRIIEAKELVFNGFEGRKESYPLKLREKVNEINASFASKQDYLHRLFVILEYLAWTPLIAGFLLHIYTYKAFFFQGAWLGRFFVILIACLFIIAVGKKEFASKCQNGKKNIVKPSDQMTKS